MQMRGCFDKLLHFYFFTATFLLLLVFPARSFAVTDIFVPTFCMVILMGLVLLAFYWLQQS
jgi:hypothetical protein